MKKSIIVVVIIVVLGLIIWGVAANRGSMSSYSNSSSGSVASSSESVPVTQTTQVSSQLSKYVNQELGFSVQYPSGWEADENDSGVTFVLPQGKSDTNTLGKLQATITVSSGKCSFPPVTTIQDRGTVTAGNLSFNMISISNSVQGRLYFDRLYTLQNADICYVFDFSSISLSPATKGYTGSQITQMTNNNKALVDAGDQAFMSVVKSFAYVIGDPGKPEASVVPTTK